MYDPEYPDIPKDFSYEEGKWYIYDDFGERKSLGFSSKEEAMSKREEGCSVGQYHNSDLDY